MIKDLDPNYADFPDSGDGDDLSYMIEGTKGVGRVRFKSGESDNQFVIQSGTLEMSSGEVYELVPPQGQDH
jgi:hypothetical protein